VAAAVKIAQKLVPGSILVTMLADTGERYLFPRLFAGITEESDDVRLATQ
jgi:hypothetical protein